MQRACRAEESARRAEERARTAEERARTAEERAQAADRTTVQYKLLLIVLGGTVALSLSLIWGGKK